jgi:hypothetical protein
MQLGSRFSVGQAPSSLPSDLLDAISHIEAELSEEEKTTLRWTLTWLEGRPIVELDNGTTLS